MTEDGYRETGFCSATCTDKACLNKEVAKALNTSDLLTTCDLPKRFKHPHWFNGYGSQARKQHPFYRTSASEYGWYPPDGNRETGFCSATCTDKACLNKEVAKTLKTSDVLTTCNLPKRFEHPHWFNGYGSQARKQHPFYRTSASEYGWYPPGIHSVCAVFFPSKQQFTNRLYAAGMYRNYSLNTGMDRAGY